MHPFAFALDREYLNLDKWPLADNVATHGAEFLRPMISFLEVKVDSEKVLRVSNPPVDSHMIIAVESSIRGDLLAYPSQ